MKVILVDDERLALDYLEMQLKKASDITIVGKFQDPMLAKKRVAEGGIDVIFLDINLPEIDGIQLAEHLLEINPNIHIVFVTAYDEYAVKAFELEAIDYIVKPISPERLAKTLHRIETRLDAKAPLAKNECIRMTMLKQVSIETSKGEVIHVQWRTTRAYELFLYLLQHRGQWVRKSVLVEVLWPEYESGNVYSQLYTAVYHVRKSLKLFGDHFQIANSTDGYVLTLHHVRLDAEEWERKLNSAPPISPETIRDYRDIMKLYTGDYLQELDLWWAESERHRLRTLWLRTSLQMAQWYWKSNDLDEAIELYLHICSRHELAEEAHFCLMQIYASKGNVLAVNRQYRLLVSVLEQELNERPSPYITEWYRDWKADKQE
ncbi:response regulator [Paenibacillus chartarius]|uniref:Response regulator n=1 Tax=Paenibacillus chartarius TaxID=747481 RepID=A0ABV6DTM4_9BACL